MFGRFVDSVPFALGGASYVKGGVAAAEADGSVELVGFRVGLGGWREEKVEEDEKNEDGGHRGLLQVGDDVRGVGGVGEDCLLMATHEQDR